MENKRGRCRYGARSTVVARVWLCRKFVRRQQPRKVPHFIARRSHTHKSAMTHAGTVILQLEKTPVRLTYAASGNIAFRLNTDRFLCLVTLTF